MSAGAGRPCWTWRADGSRVEVARVSGTRWTVRVDGEGCTDVWEVVRDGDGYRSVGHPHGDGTAPGLWLLCPSLCTEYEPVHTTGWLL